MPVESKVDKKNTSSEREKRKREMLEFKGFLRERFGDRSLQILGVCMSHIDESTIDLLKPELFDVWKPFSNTSEIDLPRVNRLQAQIKPDEDMTADLVFYIPYNNNAAIRGLLAQGCKA